MIANLEEIRYKILHAAGEIALAHKGVETVQEHSLKINMIMDNLLKGLEIPGGTETQH